MNAPSTRIDKWLWYARFFKTRTRATEQCEGGRVRINGSLVCKAHHSVRPGDVLTFPLGRDIRVIRIIALGNRRGPTPEAQALYEDLSPSASRSEGEVSPSAPQPARDAGSGRPTKAERRAFDRLRDRE